MFNAKAFLAFIIVIVALLRLLTLLPNSETIVDRPERDQVLVDQAKGQQLVFDEAASVLLGPGPDGAPGVAGVDDGMPPDGRVDNLAELGAMDSDDQCVAPWEESYESMIGKPFVVTISRGTFVPVQEAKADRETRFIAHGGTGNDRWSWIVIP